MKQIIRSHKTLLKNKANGAGLVMKGSTGKAADPAPTNLIKSPKFEVLSDWAMLSSGGIVKKTDTPPAGYSSYATLTSDDGSYDRLEPTTAITGLEVGKTYRARAYVRKGTGTITSQGFYAFTFTNGAENATGIDTADWQWIEVDVVATGTSGLLRLYITRGGAPGHTLDCAEIQLYKLN